MPLEKRRVNASLAYILVLSSFVAALNTQTVRAISNRTPLLVLPSTNNDRPSQGWDIAFTLRRGGAIEDSDDAYDLDESEFEEEYDSEDEDDVKLSASAVAAARKAKSKESKQSKKKVNASLKKSTKKKRSSPLKKVPYILRAILNPFTVFAMTKGYFLSLFDIDYMKQDTTQDLRSALQEKAKKSGSSGGKRARKMKPGQAKTLSDLPVLNA